MTQGTVHGERRCFSPRSGFVQYSFTQVDGEEFMDGMKKIQVKHHHHQSGFSLVELAVVIFIIGLIASMSFGAFKAQMVNASIRATKTNQNTIKDALTAYLGKNRRLPCPAVDNLGGLDTGVTVRTTASPPNCITNFGIIPYAELGLSKNVALDGWDNFFTYAVSPQWTATFTLYPTPTYTSCPQAIANLIYNGLNKTCDASQTFNPGNTGIITVNTRLPNGTLATPPMTTSAVALLISYGANGNGAYTTKGTQNSPPLGSDEIENAILPNFLPFTVTVPFPTAPVLGFFQREYTDNVSLTGGGFDDVITILNSNDLIAPLVKDGVLQSALSTYAIQVSNIQDWIASQISSNGCKVPAGGAINTPTGIPQNLTSDPWGKILNATSSPFTYAYTNNLPSFTFNSSTVFSAAAHNGINIYTLANTQASPTQYQARTITGNNLLSAYPYLNSLCP
jgi:prepilin-type N-terminal cleavage/methylation domain-containing protein